MGIEIPDFFRSVFEREKEARRMIGLDASDSAIVSNALDAIEEREAAQALAEELFPSADSIEVESGPRNEPRNQTGRT